MVSLSQAKPSKTIDVSYKGIAPDTFKEGGIAIVEGHYLKNGIFEADKLLAKCPSKYQSAKRKQ